MRKLNNVKVVLYVNAVIIAWVLLLGLSMLLAIKLLGV